MMRFVRLLVTSLILTAMMLAAGSSIPAQVTVFEIDPTQTKVEFTLADVLHTVHGTFQLKRGDIRFDPATGNASGELVVDAASGNSGNGSRDHKMNRDVLQSGLYPEIVFQPDRLEGKIAADGASRVQMHGVFRIHGAGHELAMPLDIQAANGRYTATTHFAIPYVQWGMKNPSTLFLRVSDKVEITIHTAARPARQ